MVETLINDSKSKSGIMSEPYLSKNILKTYLSNQNKYPCKLTLYLEHQTYRLKV